MPKFVKLLIGLMSAQLALRALVVLFNLTDGLGWFDLLVPAVLLLAFFRGSEGARYLLMLGALHQLVLGTLALLAVPVLLTRTLDAAGQDALGAFMAALVGMGFAALPLVVGGLTLYALRREDVQQRMLNRALGGALEA